MFFVIITIQSFFFGVHKNSRPHKLFISEAMATSRDSEHKILGKGVFQNDLMSMSWRGNDVKHKNKEVK